MWRTVLSILLYLFVLSGSAVAGPTAKGFLDLFAPRRSIDQLPLGVNAFMNDQRFGSIQSQFLDIRKELGIRYVRVLFNWGSDVQSSPNTQPNYSFYDDIIAAAPKGVKLLVILTGVPDWMYQSGNWIDQSPRTTFVQKWVRPTIQRYRKSKKIVAWQIWNEPNDESNPANVLMDFVDKPVQYLDLLAKADSVIQELTPKRKTVMAATTAINQNYPDTLEYNQELLSLGAQSFTDIWAIHFYGSSIERLVFDTNIPDFLNELSLPIWVTESGKQGTSKQLEYVERFWTLLDRLVPGIERFLFYQYSDGSTTNSYGLRTLKGNSDLYNYLRQH